jgi:TM2 domain-containing membrane protein YozV
VVIVTGQFRAGERHRSGPSLRKVKRFPRGVPHAALPFSFAHFGKLMQPRSLAPFPFLRRTTSTLGVVLSLLLLFSLAAPAFAAPQQQTSGMVHAAGERTPEPVLALILGLIVPGAGHLYAGDTQEGLLIFALGLLSCTLLMSVLLCVPVLECLLLSLILHNCILTWSAWGAYRISMERRHPPAYPLSAEVAAP